MKSITNIISIALIGFGAAVFAVASKPLVASKEADVPLNVLGVNRSPYGEVFAMAMQGSIGTYFHAAEGGGSHKCDGSETCHHEQIAENQSQTKDDYTEINDRAKHFIEGMASGLTERTNTRAASAAHTFYLRRGIEDKLRFAYNLDPGHYGNYNAYHFFLTEPQLGTRPELTPMAAKLADETIAYCLSRRDDPRLALTAAAAGANVIELMFNDRHVHPENPRFSVEDMQGMLGITDKAIGSFSAICENWTEQGLWENLSGHRLMEIEERMRFVLKVRESQSQAIAVLSMTPFDYGIYNPGNTWRTMGEPKIDPFSYGATPSVDTPNRDNGNGKRSPDELSGTGISSSSIASHNQK